MRDDLITILTPATEFEANVLAIVLRDHDIEAYVFAVPIVGIGVPLSGGTIGVPLQVPKHDLEHAKKVLIENKQHSIDIDWDELELGGSDAPYIPGRMNPVAKFIVYVIIASIIALLIATVLNLIFV